MVSNYITLFENYAEQQFYNNSLQFSKWFKFQNHPTPILSTAQTFLHNLNISLDSSQSKALTHHRATNKNEQIHHWQRKKKHLDLLRFRGIKSSLIASILQDDLAIPSSWNQLTKLEYLWLPFSLRQLFILSLSSLSLSICNSFFSFQFFFFFSVHFSPLTTQERWTGRQRRGCVIIISDVISDSCFRFTCSLYTCRGGKRGLVKDNCSTCGYLLLGLNFLGDRRTGKGEKFESVRRLRDGRLKDDVGEPRYCGITGGINGRAEDFVGSWMDGREHGDGTSLGMK